MEEEATAVEPQTVVPVATRLLLLAAPSSSLASPPPPPPPVSPPPPPAPTAAASPMNKQVGVLAAPSFFPASSPPPPSASSSSPPLYPPPPPAAARPALPGAPLSLSLQGHFRHKNLQSGISSGRQRIEWYLVQCIVSSDISSEPNLYSGISSIFSYQIDRNIPYELLLSNSSGPFYSFQAVAHPPPPPNPVGMWAQPEQSC